MNLFIYLMGLCAALYCLFRFAPMKVLRDGEILAGCIFLCAIWPILFAIVCIVGPPAAAVYGIYKLAQKHRR